MTEQERERLEELRKEIYGKLKRLMPDDIDDVIISLTDDLWDEVEMSSEPLLLQSYRIVDGYLSGEEGVKWDDLLQAIATLEAYRRVTRRVPLPQISD